MLIKQICTVTDNDMIITSPYRSVKSSTLVAITDAAGVVSALFFCQFCDRHKVRWLVFGNVLFITGVLILLSTQLMVDIPKNPGEKTKENNKSVCQFSSTILI